MKISKRNRDAMSSVVNSADQVTTLTKMLMYIITIFVICNSASGIIILMLVVFGGWIPADIEIFSCIPLIINSSVNFAIYILIGSKFRAEFLKLFTAWVRVCWMRARPRVR